MYQSHNIAIVGSGPGGAAAARALIEQGHHVTVFEAGQVFDPSSNIYDGVSRYYRNGGVIPCFGKMPFGFGEGRVFGGGSRVNGHYSGHYLHMFIMTGYVCIQKPFCFKGVS